jgi:chitodextrinase
MFGRNKWLWLAVIAFALLCAACDLEKDNQDGEKSLSAPTNVRAVAVSPTSISITWNSVSGATSYEVHYVTGSMPITKVSTVPGTSHTHTGLQPNTEYHYFIIAKNDSGASDYSLRASATTPSTM